jgi:predicted permease
MGSLGQDLRYGLRMLGQSPGFTAVAVLSLALGIGSNATVYSWVQAVLLHPLPGVQNSSQLLAVETQMPNGSYHTSSYPDYKDYRDQNQVFSGLIAFELIPANFSIEENQTPERIWGQIVTGNYFDVLGVHAHLGRTFLPEEDRGLNAHPVLVISYGLWRTRFAGDPNIIGKTARFNQHPFTIIGVAPREFQGTIVGVASSFWVPMMMQPQVLPAEDLEQRAPTFIHLMGRLKPGVTIQQAQANMTTIARRLEQQYPDTNKNTGIYVCPVWKAHYGLQDYLLRVLAFLTVVVALVLLIACANVANLLLARASVRAKEIAIRSALGAGRARLVRQLLAESLLLALLGGAGGVLLALWTSHLLMLFLPPANLPVTVPLSVDGRVLSFTLLVSLLTGIIFGLVPALQISRPDINESLKEGGRTFRAGASHHRLRNLLVVSEMVLALVTLVGAGLLVRSLRNAQNASVGFNPDHVLLASMDLRPNGYSGPQAVQFFERLRERIATLPEVQSVSTERYVPLWFYGRAYTRPKIEGYTSQPNEDMYIDYNMVGPNYFTMMQIPLVRGRDFSSQDRVDAPLVCIVNETMARRFWPGQDAIGRRIDAGSGWRTIVGVARDIKYHSINESPESFLYFPALQESETEANVLVRTSNDPRALLGAVRHEVQALDPNAAILTTADLGGLLHVSLFAQRTAASLATVLGLLGMLLAAVGIYGVLSYSVSQRTHEIGIRIALGALPGDIVSLVVGKGMRLVLISLAIGLFASLLATRVMSSLLFGVSATDPLTFFAVALLLAAAALAACYLPARRAMRVDPMVALRYE